MTISRLDKEDYFFEVALTVSKRSTCMKKHVGAIIVRDGRIITTGYNGSLPGQAHCTRMGCLLSGEGKCVRTVHAEVNAILQGAIIGVSVTGAAMYTTHEPCPNCLKIITAVGISEVYVYDPEK